MAPSLSLPPLEFCLGVRPSHAAKSRPDRNTPGSGTLAATAEAISVLFQSGILAQSFGSGTVTPSDVARALVGAVAKEGEEDLKAVREYCETVAKGRTGAWKELYGAAKVALRS